MSRIFTSSRACKWNEPRQQQHASTRLHVHGKVLPMQGEPGLLSQLVEMFRGRKK